MKNLKRRLLLKYHTKRGVLKSITLLGLDVVLRIVTSDSQKFLVTGLDTVTTPLSYTPRIPRLRSDKDTSWSKS